MTVHDMFELIEIAVDESIDIDFRDVDKGFISVADRVIVEYDDLFGYPKMIWIDYIETMADEEIAVELVSFEIVD